MCRKLSSSRLKSSVAVLMLATLLGACGATSPAPGATGAPAAGSPNLNSTLASNCVSSRGSGGLVALRYVGTPAQATAMVQATLASFPEATVVRREPLAMEVIFTPRAGFRDQVDFRIDPQAQRVDFRSGSLLGLYDWGKSRSRMLEFTSRFEQQAPL